MSKTTKVIIHDRYGETKADVIDHNDHDRTIHTHYDQGYYSKVSMDGNSNMIVEWKHGEGQGRISLPRGICFDIFQAMEVMQKMGSNLTEDKIIYKDET